ncbi:hypothetical protein TIFTF001_041886 [Ficus carica]|uniref:Uncharacterized protein n=1 Tax=Ficus carica TaxID=3494 RepID=A0AA88A380_FICCA|nr:hypothetical protein TIFTF001_041886 [Ficus carica]
MSAKSHTNTVLLPQKLILWGSIVATLVLVQLPYEKVDGKPVPTILFKNNPSLFVVYILSLNFSVFGSFTTISLQERYPRLGRCCLFLAVVSMAIGIAILAWLSVPSPFNLVAVQLRVY